MSRLFTQGPSDPGGDVIGLDRRVHASGWRMELEGEKQFDFAYSRAGARGQTLGDGQVARVIGSGRTQDGEFAKHAACPVP
jgi:hypothetical protein